MSTLFQAPSATILTPGTLAPSAIWMWAEILFNVLLASSGCISFSPFLPVLTFAQFVQLALQWAGDAQRAIPKRKLAPPLRPVSLLRRLRPLPQGSSTTAWLLSLTSTSGCPSRYPCSICSLEVGKDSLKCYTCSKWVHFSCSSLTRADFRKICVAGSPMGWNCPDCLNGDLASPTHRPASPRVVSPALPPPTPTPLACSDLMDSSLPLPSHPSFLNTCPLSAFTLFASSPPPTASQPVHNLPPHSQENPRLSHNLRIVQWNAGGLSSSSRAELIAFLSGNHYDLILLQETHLSSTKKFQIPDYYTLRTDRTFGRQGPFPPVLITLVVVSSLSSTLTWISLLFLSPLCLPRTPTQTTPVLKSFFPTTLLFNFLTSTPLPSETVLLILAPGPSILTSFLTPLTLSSSETSMLTTQRGTDSFPLTRSEMT